MALATIVMQIMLVAGCADRPEASPELAADLRPAAHKLVTSLTTLTDANGRLIPVAGRLRDSCTVVSAGVITAPDRARDYVCTTGRAALYATHEIGAAATAELVDQALLALECRSDSPLSGNVEDLENLNRPGPTPRVVVSFYLCDGASLSVALAARRGTDALVSRADGRPAIDLGTIVLDEPPIGESHFRAAEAEGADITLLVDVRHNYFSVSVCGDLSLCD